MIAIMATGGRRKTYVQPNREYGSSDQPLFLTEWMVAKGISDAEMGRKLGYDRSTVGKWQEEQTRLDPLKIVRICGVLGIWPSQLWVKPGSQEDRIIQAAMPEPGPYTTPEVLPKIPRPPTRK